MTFDTELQRQQDATAIATQIKEQVKTVAENKNIDIEYNVDDALSLLNKIDDGTITTPTDTLDITDNGIKDVTNYASVDVNVVTPSQAKTATPTTSQQVVEPDSGYLLSSVTVNAVTSAIDSNIQAGNIKDGVTILGVEGTLQEGITPTGTLNVTTNGPHDVSQYAIVAVNVPIGTQGGRYYSMRRWWNAATSLTGTMTFPIENFKLVKIRNLY